MLSGCFNICTLLYCWLLWDWHTWLSQHVSMCPFPAPKQLGTPAPPRLCHYCNPFISKACHCLSFGAWRSLCLVAGHEACLKDFGCHHRSRGGQDVATALYRLSGMLPHILAFQLASISEACLSKLSKFQCLAPFALNENGSLVPGPPLPVLANKTLKLPLRVFDFVDD